VQERVERSRHVVCCRLLDGNRVTGHVSLQLEKVFLGLEEFSFSFLSLHSAIQLQDSTLKHRNRVMTMHLERFGVSRLLHFCVCAKLVFLNGYID
jgi:hypothetical protein